MFKKFIEMVFFKKEIALLFCLIWSFISFSIEIRFNVDNLFSSSGAILTIAGLFLNIKLTAHFHLKMPNGDPLGDASKYAMITNRGTWSGNETPEEQRKKVLEVESDEIWGSSMMVVGTIIWGYGSYFSNWIRICH